ncbi:MAG: 30S ribosome-binding factor RbfA [Chitinophagaceae bacterium]
MQEGKRQKQIAGLLQQELNEIFQRRGLTMLAGGMVSISDVKITPDLLEARIYLSLFQVKDRQEVLKMITDKSWEIKRELTQRLAKQLRRMPEIKFFLDETLDYVFKMENLLKEIQTPPQTPPPDSSAE